MGQMNVAQMIHGDKINELSTPSGGKNQGTLLIDGKEYSIDLFESEPISKPASELLQEINQPETPPAEFLADFEFQQITQELIEVEHQILELLQDLSKLELPKEPQKTPSSEQNLSAKGKETEQSRPSQEGAKTQKGEVVYSSLFSLARSFNKALTETRQAKQGENTQKQQRNEEREEARSPILAFQSSIGARSVQSHENRYDREGDGKQEREGQEEEEKEGFSQQQQEQQQKQQSQKKKKIISIGRVQGARTQAKSGESSSGKSAHENLSSIESIYIRFMALMARILGQAELEAHELYQKIKERTDSIDVLTLLISKINSEKAGIDWTNNEEMKKLIQKARDLGVDIPEGKYTWTEEEKKLLKENIQMRKDSMEKMTQLERTDMQRYLQEASQCHQARSNVLKLLKEVLDTIIHNMRP